jgi:CRP-like cAMP-binding protein
MLAIGSEQRDVARGDPLFNAGDDADAGFIVQRGAFRIEDGGGAEMVAGPGALIGELALIVPMQRPSTALALEHSSVIRVARSLFQRVLESDPAAARRLRDEFASRTSQIASDILMAGAKLSIKPPLSPRVPASAGTTLALTPPASPSPARGRTAAASRAHPA